MFCNISRMLSMPVLAAMLFQAPAWAQDVSARLGQLREFSYLASSSTLAELQKLKAQVGQWPQRDQATYYSVLSKVTRSSDRATSLQAVAEQERIGRLLDDETIIANSLLDRSYLFSALDDRDAASKNLEMARQLAEQTSDYALQAKVLLTVGQDEIRQGNGRKGLDYIDRAVALADKSGQPLAQFMALRARVYALNGLAGGSQEALKSIDVLKAKAELIPLDGPLIRARYAEWEIAESAGQVARARDALNDVVAWLQKHRMDEDVPELQVTLADMSLKSQDYKEALSLSQESKKAALAIGNTEMAEISQFNEGIALIYLGRLDAGREAIEAVNIEMMDADALSEYARALEYVGLKELALQVYARARRKALDASTAQSQLRKKEREDEELLRQKDENSKELRNRSKLRLAWSVAAALAAAALLAVVFLYRKLRAANVKLKNSDSLAE